MEPSRPVQACNGIALHLPLPLLFNVLRMTPVCVSIYLISVLTHTFLIGIPIILPLYVCEFEAKRGPRTKKKSLGDTALTG